MSKHQRYQSRREKKEENEINKNSAVATMRIEEPIEEEGERDGCRGLGDSMVLNRRKIIMDWKKSILVIIQNGVESSTYCTWMENSNKYLFNICPHFYVMLQTTAQCSLIECPNGQGSLPRGSYVCHNNRARPFGHRLFLVIMAICPCHNGHTGCGIRIFRQQNLFGKSRFLLLTVLLPKKPTNLNADH